MNALSLLGGGADVGHAIASFSSPPQILDGNITSLAVLETQPKADGLSTFLGDERRWFIRFLPSSQAREHAGNPRATLRSSCRQEIE